MDHFCFLVMILCTCFYILNAPFYLYLPVRTYFLNAKEMCLFYALELILEI